MAGFQSLIQGGCGDFNGSGGTAVSKFANNFLSNQSLSSQFNAGSSGSSEIMDPLHLELLADPSHQSLQHLDSFHPQSGFHTNLPTSIHDFEDEFLQSFHEPQLLQHPVLHHPQSTDSPASMIQANLSALQTALQTAHLHPASPNLPFRLHPGMLNIEQKLDVMKQANHLLSSHQLPSQQIFDAYLAEVVSAFSIEPQVLEEVALEEEWHAAQHSHIHQQQPEALGAPADALAFEEMARQEWQLAQQHAQNAHLAAEAEAALLENEYQQHFSAVGSTTAAWHQEFEQQQEMEEVFHQVSNSQRAEDWVNELAPQLTEEELLRKEEEEWYAQFCVNSAPSTQAASWIDEFLGSEPSSSSSSSMGPSQFQLDVQNMVAEMEQIPDAHLRSSNLFGFLKDVGSGQIDVNHLTSEQTFFPA